RVLTVPAHARSEVVELLGIPEQKVIVTHLAVSPGIRRCDPAAQQAFASARGLPHAYLLHIGHRKPLKNLALVLRALGRMPPASRPPLVTPGLPWTED